MRSHNDRTAISHNFTAVIKARKDKGASSKLLYLRSRCLLPGIYHEHLEQWFEYFPHDQVIKKLELELEQ